MSSQQHGPTILDGSPKWFRMGSNVIKVWLGEGYPLRRYDRPNARAVQRLRANASRVGLPVARRGRPAASEESEKTHPNRL